MEFKCLLRTYIWTELRSDFERIVPGRVVDPYKTLFFRGPCLVFKTVLYFTETLLFPQIFPIVELDGLHFVCVWWRWVKEERTYHLFRYRGVIHGSYSHHRMKTIGKMRPIECHFHIVVCLNKRATEITRKKTPSYTLFKMLLTRFVHRIKALHRFNLYFRIDRK